LSDRKFADQTTLDSIQDDCKKLFCNTLKVLRRTFMLLLQQSGSSIITYAIDLSHPGAAYYEAL